MTVEPKQFKNPPITEAIFAISFKEIVPQDKLVLFANTEYVKNNFPSNNPGIVVEISNKKKSDAEIENKPQVSHKSEGYLLKGKEGFDRAIQVMPSMFSYHNFNKYAGWDNMHNELREVWKIFCHCVGKTNISQLSVRYLNQIALPLPLEAGFKDYINLLPQIPEDIRSDINNFFIQINVPNKGNDLEGIVTETILSQDKEKINFLIDLSVVKKGDFECDKEEIWAVFTKIREFKNQLFLSCITDKTKELFN